MQFHTVLLTLKIKPLIGGILLVFSTYYSIPPCSENRIFSVHSKCRQYLKYS